jgi:amino acid adenylation domain-containing protein
MPNPPLSQAQQGIWFLTQLDSVVSAAYNVVLAFEVEGSVHAPSLRGALEHIQSQQEVLRSRVSVVAGVPRWEVLSADEVGAPTIQVMEGSLQEVATRQAQVPFDLSAAPLYRVTAVADAKTTDLVHGLVFTFPHIAFDDGSAGAFMSQLAAAYAATLRGSRAEALQCAPLSALVGMEREFLSQPDGKDAVERTLLRLKHVPTQLELPRMVPKTAVQWVYAAGVAEILLGEALTSAVREFARRSRVTTAAVHLAAFQLLLWHYTTQSDFAISLPVSNRAFIGGDAVVGYFTNIGIVRAGFTHRSSVKEFVAGVTESLFDVVDAAGVPFPAVVRAMKRAGEEVQGPYFQVGFNHAEVRRVDWSFGEAVLRPVDCLPELLKNEFKLDVRETANGTRSWLLFDKSGFDQVVVDRMARHYQDLLAAMLSNPELTLDELPRMSDSELHQILVEWNRTQVSDPIECSVHGLIERQAEQSPDAVAVVFGDASLTYRQINERADHVAHLLMQRGRLAADSLVPICCERSVDMVIGLLGILKAGAAYVPLDPQHPAARLDGMLSDMGASLLMVQRHLRDAFSKFSGDVMLLDTDAHAGGERSAAGSRSHSHGSQLAYCIYTSGSTGTPKGALNEHGAVVNRLRWMQHQYGIGPTDIFLQKTPFTFDVSVWEFFLPLMCGASLVVLEPGRHHDPLAVLDAIEQRRVTCVHFVPSMLSSFLEAIERPACEQLRHVFCSGEALHSSLAQKFAEKLPHVSLHNLYGPTEAAVDVSFFRYGQDLKTATVPIGKPVANTQLYVLDEALRPVPVGVRGELFIAGKQVGRGYLNRPDLTAERFVPNPYGEPGARMYRTGDRVRYLSDGNLEFLGRADGQVKVRGFRIEIGEIEAALKRIPSVGGAAVMPRENGAHETRLVAYVVPAAGRSHTVADLRTALLLTLPDYMVPAEWAFLESLPLNSSGKLDRAALADAKPAAANEGHPFVAPTTRVQTILAEIWRDVLSVQTVGVHDNFFARGGHSLLAVKVLSRWRACGHPHFELHEMFSRPTIFELAAHIESNTSTVDADMPPVSRDVVARRTGRFQASFDQAKNYFYPRKTIIQNAVEVGARLSVERLTRSLQSISAIHELLRSSFTVEDGKVILEVHDASLVPVVAELDLRDCADDVKAKALTEYLAKDKDTPFDWGAAPLYRMHVIRHDISMTLLVLSIDHGIADGQALPVFWQDLSKAYESANTGRNDSPGAMLYSVVDHIAAEKARRPDDRVPALAERCHAVFGRGAEPLVFPGASTGEGFSDKGDIASYVLDPGITERLLLATRRLVTTPFVLASALAATAVGKFGRADSVLLNSMAANRTRAGTDRLVMSLAKPLPFIVDIRQGSSMVQVVKAAAASIAASMQLQEAPLSTIYEALAQQDTPNGNGYQIMVQHHVLAEHAGTFDGVPMRRSNLAERVLITEELCFDSVLVEGRLQVNVSYWTGLFQRRHVDELMDHYIAAANRLVQEI